MGTFAADQIFTASSAVHPRLELPGIDHHGVERPEDLQRDEHDPHIAYKSKLIIYSLLSSRSPPMLYASMATHMHGMGCSAQLRWLTVLPPSSSELAHS